MSACEVLENVYWQNTQSSGIFADKFIRKIEAVLEECIKAEGMVSSNLPILKSLDSLENIANECLKVGWDGYGAVPITEDAILKAKSFLNLLSEDSAHLPMPDISPEPNGGIEFEWYNPDGAEFSLSFDGTDILTYSGIFDNNTQTLGTESFLTNISHTIKANIQRIIE